MAENRGGVAKRDRLIAVIVLFGLILAPTVCCIGGFIAGRLSV